MPPRSSANSACPWSRPSPWHATATASSSSGSKALPHAGRVASPSHGANPILRRSSARSAKCAASCARSATPSPSGSRALRQHRCAGAASGRRARDPRGAAVPGVPGRVQLGRGADGHDRRQHRGARRSSCSSTLPDGPLRSLLVDGIIAGVGSVLVFLPQILILFFFILRSRTPATCRARPSCSTA